MFKNYSQYYLNWQWKDTSVLYIVPVVCLSFCTRGGGLYRGVYPSIHLERVCVEGVCIPACTLAGGVYPYSHWRGRCVLCIILSCLLNGTWICNINFSEQFVTRQMCNELQVNINWVLLYRVYFLWGYGASINQANCQLNWLELSILEVCWLKKTDHRTIFKNTFLQYH